MPTHAAPMVRLHDLNCWYGDFHALKHIRLDIAPRGVTALIGPSGCGKSTLLRCLNRMNDLVPGARVTGHLEVDGIDALHPEVDVDALRRRVGMVFQKPNPFPTSIRENLHLGPRVAGITNWRERDAIARAALERVGLWDTLGAAWHRLATALPPEQQQRLCIARMLTTLPTVLLFDEPCSTLDPEATATIERLMTELAAAHPVVVVTHNMQQAQRIADHVVYLLLGELVEVGPAAEVFAAARDPRTADYISGRVG